MLRHFDWLEVKRFSDTHKGKRAVYLKRDATGTIYEKAASMMPFGHVYVGTAPTVLSPVSPPPAAPQGAYGLIMVHATDNVRWDYPLFYSLLSIADLNDWQYKQDNNIRGVYYDVDMSPSWREPSVLLINSPDVFEFEAPKVAKSATHPHACYCGSPCYKSGLSVDCTNQKCRHYKP